MFEQYSFEVGVLQDGPHKVALPKSRGLRVVAGGPARKTGSKVEGTLAEVSEENRKKTELFTKPFKKKTSDITKFTREFFKLTFKKSTVKKVEVFLQAIVRNPILKGAYGDNTAKTAKTKGFNRFMIDTGQFFRSIKAKVKRVRNVPKK